MNNTPLISIIVPIYKVEKYLRKCVDSILAQSYADIEVILVDDGSPDNCPAICDEYAARDKRVVVIHQSNAGVSAARNAGLETAKGEYISFVDGDDWIEPDFLEVLYEVIKSSGADIADSSNCTGDCKPAKVNIDEAVTFSSGEAVMKLMHGQWDLFYVWRKLFAREVVKDIRFNTSFANFEDGLFVTEAIVNSRQISCIDYQSYHYTIRADSASHAFKENFWSMLNAVDMILDIIKKNDGELVKYADKCALEYDIMISKQAVASGNFSKYAHKKVTSHIKKHKTEGAWQALSKNERCWGSLLLSGRIPFIAARKLSGALKKMKKLL